MAFRSLREFLDRLEAMGDLHRIKEELDWDEEIAAVAEEASVREAPALIFENIKDHQDTFCNKLTMNHLGNYRRIALAMDLPLDAHPRDFLKAWRERTKNPIKPILVNSGPCKEVIRKDDDINLMEIPFLKLHAKDGGRYTVWNCNITKDPETGWTNVGTYNAKLHDEKSLVLTYRFAHSAVHGKKYRAKGERMPYALVIGTEPILSMTGSAAFEKGVCEYDMAGAIKREPLELVKCETVDLEVPADAEIVIEGTVSLDRKDFKMEGPFGRFTGYYYGLKPTPSPVLDVTCVTHRKDPIYITCLSGPGPDLVATEGEYIFAINSCAVLWDQLEKAGIRGITGLWTDPDMVLTNIFISIKNSYYGHAKHVASALWGTEKGRIIGKYVVVVDSDVDIYDVKKINSAIGNRTRGKEDIVIFPHTYGAPTDPGVELMDPEGFIKAWDRVLVDATWPFEWEPRKEWGGLKHPESGNARPALREEVRKKWNSFGFK
jgi:4-hydroxy-3-polyprenylbenzoate decarboxylase